MVKVGRLVGWLSLCRWVDSCVKFEAQNKNTLSNTQISHKITKLSDSIKL